MSRRDKGNGNGGGSAKARAGLGLRITLITLATVLALGSAWAGANMLAVRGYNAATASLARNLQDASRDDADLDRLNAAQQQTDAQFSDAGMLGAVLLPSVSKPIAANAEVSRQLSALIADALARQQGGSSSDSGSSAQNGGDGTNSDSQPQGEQGLSDEQQKKVDELIRQNQQLASASPSPSSSTTTSSAPSEQSTAKPW
ncbi:DUF6466 family protein [Bifidobacterium avesanii]|uniref:Cell surface protein n=1 Tax=Bifidobacterium avesanii TaxID=1798157 RepID=A0A7K3TFE2_9BIFI|nr:DUF6466 family protein [Bifidobacterium avesanii]KAB8295622.1 cell surface protein [Bifidobacterium avesanii]NEG77626.1 cell surface protein [Bifidobacterium avesanii]